MKKIILFLLIGIILISGCTKEGCSYWTMENCDKSCLTDSDCKQGNCCDCINIEESCSTIKKGIFQEGVFPNCVQATCECVNNQCQIVE